MDFEVGSELKWLNYKRSNIKNCLICTQLRHCKRDEIKYLRPCYRSELMSLDSAFNP